MRLDDTRIVVTGASAGLGREMTEAFVDEGAAVVCAARSLERLEALEQYSESEPGDAVGVRCDVRVRSDVEALMREVGELFDGVDVFVNNAGVKQSRLTGGYERPVGSLPVDVWDTVVDTNLRGAFLCSRAAVPLLCEVGGRIIHLTSGMGQEGRAGRSAYVASKFGLEGLHQSLADELGDTEAESVLLDPGGGVDTDGFSAHLDEAERAGRLDPSAIVEPALRLAEGFGSNGGRYIATEISDADAGSDGRVGEKP